MRRREKSLAALMLALSMVVLPALPAQAGKSTSVVDTTTYENSLDESVWHNADGDILVEKGLMKFERKSVISAVFSTFGKIRFIIICCLAASFMMVGCKKEEEEERCSPSFFF